MNQSRLESLLEILANVGSGFIIAWITMQFIVTPLWQLETSAAQNTVITILFTGISIARGYVWRRFFNAGIHRAIRNFARAVS